MATVSHRATKVAPALAEIRRLRRRHATAMAAAADAIAAAVDAGYTQALDDLADLIGGRALPIHPDPIHLRRYYLLCPACRRTPLTGSTIYGGRAGCPDCQQRDRGSFGQPMPGDYPGQAS